MLVPELIEHVCSSASGKARALGRQIVFSMTSNATLIDERRAALIHRHNIATMLSLDGIGEAHDRYRKTVSGKGSFRLIERNLERLVGLPGAKIRLTVGPETAAQLARARRRGAARCNNGDVCVTCDKQDSCVSCDVGDIICDDAFDICITCDSGDACITCDALDTCSTTDDEPD